MGGRAGEYEPDADLRDFENVPLKDDIDAYFSREVRPHVPDAWMDRSKDKVGYEVNFNRHFYKYTPPRPLEVDRRRTKASRKRDHALATGGDGVSAVVPAVQKQIEVTSLAVINEEALGDRWQMGTSNCSMLTSATGDSSGRIGELAGRLPASRIRAASRARRQRYSSCGDVIISPPNSGRT